MTSWDEIPQDGTITEGGEGWPTIPDDVYEGVIVEVGEPYERETPKGKAKKFVIRWELSGGDLDEPVQIPQFVTLPPKFLSDGFLTPKSTLFKVMKALGFDMEGQFVVRPWEWVGMKARVDTENGEPDQQGNVTSWITGIKPPRAKKPPVKQAVGASARKASGWDEEDE